jgi:hypothetical protein
VNGFPGFAPETDFEVPPITSAQRGKRSSCKSVCTI